MQSLAIHPALWQLLRFHALGKIRKLRASFSSPRRQVLSLMAVLLTVVWLGNAVASVLLRDAYEPAVFGRWMSRCLLLYFCWHLIRVAYSRPESAVEWSAAEETFLCGGPFSRRELLTYRLMGIFSATLPKALLVTFVMLPDLPMVWSGFCGLLLGLVFLEYVRLILETLATGISARQYLLLRASVFGGLAALMGYGLIQAVSLVELKAGNHWPFLQEWAQALGNVNDAAAGQMIEAPFRLIAYVVTAEQVSTEFLAHLGGAVLLISATAHAAVRLDGVFYRRTQDAELAHSGELKDETSANVPASWPRIIRLHGAGTVAWRQLDFAKRHWGTLSVGLGFPALLSCLPLFVPGEGTATFLTVLGSVVFYSYVLLPAALKLDFRRDFDHLALLKSLPLRPLAVVLGQLLAPVGLTWAFQIVLLTLAAAVCGVPWAWAFAAVLFLLPVNLFFAALDNLIFLLYPHRLHQEGLEVFLRTTLTFTGKGVLLTLALFGMMAWLEAARWLTIALGQSGQFRVIFGAGIASFAALAAGLGVWLSVRVFSHMDPIGV